jgi:hypothetical protein
MALSKEKSAKLFRALAQVIDAHLELDRIRAEVYAQDEPADEPTDKPDTPRAGVL